MTVVKDLPLANNPLNFFNCYLADPQQTFGHYQGDSFTHPVLITAFCYIQPSRKWDPRNQFGTLSQIELLVGFEQGTLPFQL